MKIKKKFFNNSAEIVARDILGKILVRKINNKELRAKIVETEAYFSKEDPASRAVQNGDLRKTMEMEGGTILVYGVHNNWLVNFVTGEEKKAEAVLIRALEPLNFSLNCSGPGLLCKSLDINKKFHKKKVFYNNEIWIEKSSELNFEVIRTKRIGIKKDLPGNFRFYIKDNKYVSKK
jgi:DNA-3-methyladenine glycosylase